MKKRKEGSMINKQHMIVKEDKQTQGVVHEHKNLFRGDGCMIEIRVNDLEISTKKSC